MMEKSAMNDIYLPVPATTIRTRPMTATEKFFEFKLDSGKELGHLPGQFAEVSLPGIGEAPISISSPPEGKGTFEMVIRRVGNVTAAIHNLKEGDTVWIRGPFGTNFPVGTVMKGKDVLFVCGGIGLIPLRSAIKYVLAKRGDYGKITILSGTKTPQERLFPDELAAWGARGDVELLESVDQADGSWEGNVGVVTTLFQKIKPDPKKTVAVICGPPVMYKFTLLELRKLEFNNDNVYMSLERQMKCGVGKCGHCQAGSMYICQDGPVVSYSAIASQREAI